LSDFRGSKPAALKVGGERLANATGRQSAGQTVISRKHGGGDGGGAALAPYLPPVDGRRCA